MAQDEQKPSLAPQRLSEDALQVFGKMLDQQAAETELERERVKNDSELERLRIMKQAEESERNFQIAQKAIDAQERHLVSSTKSDASKLKTTAWFLIVIALIGAGVTVVAMFTGQAAWLGDLIERVLYALGGGIVGYGGHKLRTLKKDTEDADSPSAIVPGDAD